MIFVTNNILATRWSKESTKRYSKAPASSAEKVWRKAKLLTQLPLSEYIEDAKSLQCFS